MLILKDNNVSTIFFLKLSFEVISKLYRYYKHFIKNCIYSSSRLVNICHICLIIPFVSVCICVSQHTVFFSEAFESKLQVVCPFSPKYFSVFSKNKDSFSHNYSMVIKIKKFDIDIILLPNPKIMFPFLQLPAQCSFYQFSSQSGITHCIRLVYLHSPLT